MMEPTDIEIKQIKEVEKNTLDQLKIIQQEIAQILSQNQSFPYNEFIKPHIF